MDRVREPACLWDKRRLGEQITAEGFVRPLPFVSQPAAQLGIGA